jgi:hypothetical protein
VGYEVESPKGADIEPSRGAKKPPEAFEPLYKTNIFQRIVPLKHVLNFKKRMI